jgi:hypothetical protein
MTLIMTRSRRSTERRAVRVAIRLNAFKVSRYARMPRERSRAAFSVSSSDVRVVCSGSGRTYCEQVDAIIRTDVT